jgi:hypothetical protein
MISRRPFGFGEDGSSNNIDKAIEYILFNEYSFSDAEEDEEPYKSRDELAGDGLDNDLDEEIYDDIFEGDPFRDLIEGGDAD